LIVQSTEMMRTMLEVYTTHHSHGNMLPSISGTIYLFYHQDTHHQYAFCCSRN